MSALSNAQAARIELHKSTYWPAAQRQKGANHLWLTDVFLAATIAELTPKLIATIHGQPLDGHLLTAAIEAAP